MKKHMDEEILNMLVELMTVLKESAFDTRHGKRITESMLKTFSEVMVDNTAFHRLIADPTTDISQFEPIIKMMMKKKKVKKKAKK